MSNFENYDFILPDGVVIENEKADKEGRKKRMSAMCVKVREQTNMNRKEFAEWLGIPYRTMQDWERGVSEVPDYVLNLIAYKVKNEKEKDKFYSSNYINFGTHSNTNEIKRWRFSRV